MKDKGMFIDATEIKDNYDEMFSGCSEDIKQKLILCVEISGLLRAVQERVFNAIINNEINGYTEGIEWRLADSLGLANQIFKTKKNEKTGRGNRINVRS